jgi:hypothetical protein
MVKLNKLDLFFVSVIDLSGKLGPTFKVPYSNNFLFW